MTKINSKTIFNFYLKGLNNIYALPSEITQNFFDTINTINKVSPLDSSKYYHNLIAPFGTYLVPDFEYLLVVGLYFSLISMGNVIFDQKYLKEIIKLMSEKNDPLKELIFPNNKPINNVFTNYSSHMLTKIFEFLGSNFTGQSGWVAKPDQLPNQIELIQLQMKAKNLLLILQQKQYIDKFLQEDLKKFLSDFSNSLPNFSQIQNFVNNFNKDEYRNNNPEVWKKIISTLSSVLGTINEFTKPYTIASEQELNNFLITTVYLNLSTKDQSQFYKVIQTLENDKLKNVIDDLIIDGARFNIKNKELIQNISKDLYSIFVGILSSYFKKQIKNGNIKYGDSFSFLQLYLLSSILLEMINNNQTNTLEYINTKHQLKNILITKNFPYNFNSLLDSTDKNLLISTLEVIKRLGQKVAPWVIQKSPDMPKDKSFWIRLNLWTKIYNSLDKNNPNYKANQQYMMNKLRSIISSYSDTTKFSILINTLLWNENNFSIFIKSLDSILNTIAGFPVAFQYKEPDHLYSQIVRLSFLMNEEDKNKQYMKNSIHTELIMKIMSKEHILNRVIIDFNDYKTYLKGVSNLEKNLYTVLNTFYSASVYY